MLCSVCAVIDDNALCIVQANDHPLHGKSIAGRPDPDLIFQPVYGGIVGKVLRRIGAVLIDLVIIVTRPGKGQGSELVHRIVCCDVHRLAVTGAALHHREARIQAMEYHPEGLGGRRSISDDPL